MKVTIEAKELVQLLELVSRVSTKHVTLPVLQCVLLEAQDKKLSVRATNLELAIEATITADVTEVGIIAVPATVLLQTINLITERTITFETKEQNLHVSTKSSQAEIKCIPHDEFPSIPKLTGTGQALNGAMFSLGIKTTAFAASASSIKPELGSIYIFQRKEHSLTFVTTDSFRLVEKTVPQKGVILDNALLVPYKNAIEIGRMYDVLGTDPIMRVSDTQFSLEFSQGVYVTSRLTTGSFPDYEQIIPKEYMAHTSILKHDLLHAFKKTNIFLNRFQQVVLALQKQSVTVSATNGEVGTTTETVSASTDGEPLTLSFNQRYVAEALPHFIDDSITLHFAGIGRPLVIKGSNDSTLRYLVMPMNK